MEKMVNVGSRIPFNLHNQVIPPETNHTLSRSASGYFDDDYGGTYHPQPALYPQFTTPDPFDHDSYYSRSRHAEHDGNSNPILDVKLVGYVSRRGRTPRWESDVDLAAGTTPTQKGHFETESLSAIVSLLFAALSPHLTRLKELLDKAKLQEIGALTFSWGD
ncbi:hypothetical protein DXG03_001813 [Asterophora parasitica]|uniref:Uncharacterized protein n=1 Tax=Asterophora parasitica TaxID=117018 RepID=A0A9P7G533_9AGAR|nr:hypothetical protein DXG03_001813 [Asterophora parasitica]